MVKVSVIIPVYNGEEHLRQCLDSVLGQTLREIEIICVDDGSTDASFGILKEYEQKDSRVKVLQQQNLYAGVARNKGKEAAQGEYLAFWDCDDFFEPECLEQMYRKAVEQQADICVCGGRKYLEDQDLLIPAPRYLDTKMLPEQDVFSIKDNAQYILNFTIVPAWNKLFRKSFIEEEQINFQGVKNGNDVFFTVNALCRASRITTIDKALVNYRTNQEESIVGNMAKNPHLLMKVWMETAESLMEHDCMPEQSFANRAIESILFLLQKLQTWEAYEEVLSQLKGEGLQRLHIIDKEDYYYRSLHQEFVGHLLHDSPQDLLMYISHSNYVRYYTAQAQKKAISLKLKKKNTKIKSLQDELERGIHASGKKSVFRFLKKKVTNQNP